MRRTARRAWVAAAITSAAPVSGGRVSSFRDAWKHRVHDCSCFRPYFEFQTAPTLLCAAIVSFRSLIPRFITAIGREQLTEIHAGVTHRLNCSKMFVFRRAPRPRLQARFLKRRRLRCGRPFRAEALPQGRAGLRPLALPLALFAVAIRNGPKPLAERPDPQLPPASAAL
jgi:hypothetical protein